MAEVFVRQPSGEMTMAAQAEVVERLSRLGAGARSDACRLTFSRYERDLLLWGLSDAHVAGAHSRRRLLRPLLWSMAKVVVALPFAAIGFVVHIVPFQIVKQLAKRPTNEGIKATVKLLGCTALFAIVYAAAGVIVGRAYGVWAGLSVAAGVPACGYLSVRCAERVKQIGGLVQAYRTLSGRREVLRSVAADRSSFVSAVSCALGAPPLSDQPRPSGAAQQR
jgi:hypothetical protein